MPPLRTLSYDAASPKQREGSSRSKRMRQRISGPPIEACSRRRSLPRGAERLKIRSWGMDGHDVPAFRGYRFGRLHNQ